MADITLAQYFKFDGADLQANRTGHFTEKQKARLAANDKSNRTWSLTGGIVLAVIALGGLGSAVAAVIGSTDNGFRLAFGLGFGCVWPLVWGGIAYGLISSALSKHKYKLARVQGHAKIVRIETHSSESHSTSIHYELHVGGQKFRVGQLLMDVINQDDQHEYVLYYVDSADKNASSPAFVKNLDSIQSVEELNVDRSMSEQAKVETRERGNLVMIDCGPKKIETLKVIRQLTGLGLADAKVIAETTHAVILKDVDGDTAREAMALFANAGANVSIE
jgi:ribosomal protein L7/L12